MGPFCWKRLMLPSNFSPQRNLTTEPAGSEGRLEVNWNSVQGAAIVPSPDPVALVETYCASELMQKRMKNAMVV